MVNYETKRRESLKEFIVELVASCEDKAWAAVTLTLKQFVRRQDGTVQKLSVSEIRKCISTLMKMLNKKSYKAAYRRFGKRLFVVPSIERSVNDRLHVHMLLEIPPHLRNAPLTFHNEIAGIWTSLRWGLPEHDIQNLPPSNVTYWLRYILKDLWKDSEVIDLTNLYLGEDKNSSQTRCVLNTY